MESFELLVHVSEVLGDVSSLLVNDLVALLHDHHLAVGKHCVHPLEDGLDHSDFKFRLASEEAIGELFDSRCTLILSRSSWVGWEAAPHFLPSS